MSFSKDERVVMVFVVVERFQRERSWLELPCTSNQVAAMLDVSQSYAWRLLAYGEKIGLLERERSVGRTGGKAWNWKPSDVTRDEFVTLIRTGSYLLSQAGLKWI
jgi:hypothetical protein